MFDYVLQAMNASELTSIKIKKSTAMSLDEDILEEENDETDDDPQQDNQPSAPTVAELQRSSSCSSADTTKK